MPLDPDYVGPATIAGYTVIFTANVPSHAVAICDTPDGTGTVVRADDPKLLQSMMRDEHCGRVVDVRAGAETLILEVEFDCMLAGSKRIRAFPARALEVNEVPDEHRLALEVG